MFIQFFPVGFVRKRIFSARVRISRSRSSKVIDFCTNRKRIIMDFLLIRHSDHGPILYRFRDIARLLHPTSIPPYFCGGGSRCTRSPIISLKLISREITLYCPSIPTYVITVPERHRQTDGPTDRQTDDIL